jgi:flagellar secretion chaperone FliS
MNHSAANNYLTTEVMTATPQKLQLMLINAVIQAAERARKHWLNNEYEEARKHLGRAREIVGEFFNGFDYQAKSDLVDKVAGIYLFIYRALARAELDKDLNKLDEALRVLAIERDTWRQVCENLAQSPAGQPLSKTSHTPAVHIPTSHSGTPPDLPATSFSWEA